MGKKLTTEEFIKKAKLVHGDKYDYSKTIYVNAKSKVTIFCKTCDKFFDQVADTHYECGCPTCGKNQTGLKKRTSEEDFLKDAFIKHGIKFDYSRMNYQGLNKKVDIICPIHGVIHTTPYNHLISSGCFYCGVDMRKSTSEEFIKKANLKHKNIYDYSKTDYIDCDTKVEVICKTHGTFWITPKFHLNKGKCPQCSEHFPYTTETFIEKATLIHQNKYDYSKVFYKNFETKVEIVCSKHGSFTQSPQNHIGYNKRGCPKCAKSGTKLTTQEFIDKANLVHGDKKFDYSQTIYARNCKKIDIICPKHGKFSITPNSHLDIRSGGGCIKCYRERQTGTFDDFLKNAIAIHGDKYEYHFTDYKGSKSKIKIFCKKHQSYFIQSSTRHTQGQNCPLCANEIRSKSQQNCANNWKPIEWEQRGKISKNFTGFKVYIIECWNNEEIFYKIGKTYVNIDKRFSSKISMPYNYKILKIFEGSAKEMSDLEYKLQKSNKINKYVPNIKFGGMYECFSKINNIEEFLK